MKEDNRKLSKTLKPPSQLEMREVSTGSSYSTGSIIALLLITEDARTRIEVIADVVGVLSIDKAELLDLLEATQCKRCFGRTTKLHPCDCPKKEGA